MKDDEDDLGGEFLVQLVRVLRVVQVHDLDNETVAQISVEFRTVIEQYLERFQTAGVQVVQEQVYFNQEFVKLRGAAYDAALQAKKLFARLGINEILFTGKLDAAAMRSFLSKFQTCMHSQTPADFAHAKFEKIHVRALSKPMAVGVDRKVELARTYAQLVVLIQDADQQIAENKMVPMARIRRAAQQLATASEGLDDLLVGLTRFDNPMGARSLHAVAVAALTLVMARRLGAPRRDLMSLMLSALFCDSVSLGPDVDVLGTVLAIARISQSTEALDRASVAFEVGIPAGGDADRMRPGVPAQLIAAASAYDRLCQPPPPHARVRPDQALAMLEERAGTEFDRRAVRLLTATVGVYPVGSLVELSNGARAVVMTAPQDGGWTKPTVKVLDGDFVLELDSDEGLEIANCLDAREERVGVTHFLLA